MARKQMRWYSMNTNILHTNGATTWSSAVRDTRESTGTRYEILDVDGYALSRRRSKTYMVRQNTASRFRKR